MSSNYLPPKPIIRTRTMNQNGMGNILYKNLDFFKSKPMGNQKWELGEPIGAQGSIYALERRMRENEEREKMKKEKK
jgi:hypothetical protein